MAMEALAGDPSAANNLERGKRWLIRTLQAADSIEPAPIGLYFARLWYAERLYPLAFAVSALGRLGSKDG
jgi:squalene-hopene/tetraprenyl-beta-curcumene cyclase